MGAKTCALIISIHILYLVSAQEIAKRVPHGFVGMRGKKLSSESTEQFYKRKPQFFVGVKGKKSILDEIDDMNYKRAPMGFVGMRGKKDYYFPDFYYPDSYEYAPKKEGSLIGQIDYSSTDNSKTNDVELPFLNDILTEYLKLGRSIDTATEANEEDLSNEGITNEVDKRAANMHQFYGVRGKKSIQNKRPYDLTFRGKFIGVRGKKDVKNSGAQEIRFLLGQNGPWPKRKAQMGFFGMRGKKWTDESSSELETPN